MATYYVSATTNAGSPDGLTAATAYASVTALMSGRTLAAKDLIYIAPGTYREQIDCTAEGVSGTAANPIRWVGDPNCEHFPDIQPGVVRFSLADTKEEHKEDDTFATQMIIDARNVAYHYFYNLYLDGGGADLSDISTHQNFSGVYGNDKNNDFISVFNCMFQNLTKAAVTITLAEDCAFISNGYAGPYAVKYVERCIAIGGYYPMFNCEEIANSIAMGGANMSIYNTTDVINNTVFCGRIGIYGAGANDHAWNNHIIGAGNAIQGSATNRPVVSGSRLDGCYQVANKGVYNRIEVGGGMSALTDQNSPGGALVKVKKPQCLWTMEQVREIGKNIKPLLFSKGLRGISTGTPLDKDGDEFVPYSAMATDFLGQPRSMGRPTASGVSAAGTADDAIPRDIGAFEYSTNQVSQSVTGMVTMSIEGEGQFVIPVGIASGSSFTASADVKWESGTMTQKPQLILRQSPGEFTSSLHLSQSLNMWHSGSELEICKVTHPNATTNNWETLTVSCSAVPYDVQLELVLYSRNTGSASTSSMADIFIR